MNAETARLYQEVGKYCLEPHQMVVAGDVELWHLRDPHEWHLKFPKAPGPLLSCSDGRCPYGIHAISDYAWEDPWALELLFRLERGDRVLILIEYCKKSHVSFFTFDRAPNTPGLLQFYSVEKSQDCHFFTPIRRKPGYMGHGVSIQWAALKYLAIIKSDEKPFGKFGGVECFKRELARLAKLDGKDVEEAMAKVKNLNAIPDRPPLKAGYMDWLHFSPGKRTIASILNDQLRSERNMVSLIQDILQMTEQGRFEEFVKKTKGWQPFANKRKEFKAGLHAVTDWYFSCAPTQQELMASFHALWQKAFNL